MVVNVWYSTCPPCARELADFAAVHAEIGDEVRFVAGGVWRGTLAPRGTGAPGRPADIAVDDGVITAVVDAGSDDGVDGDFDGAPDGCDNCPDDPNSDQADADGDDVGDRLTCNGCGFLVIQTCFCCRAFLGREACVDSLVVVALSHLFEEVFQQLRRCLARLYHEIEEVEITQNTVTLWNMVVKGVAAALFTAPVGLTMPLIINVKAKHPQKIEPRYDTDCVSPR